MQWPYLFYLTPHTFRSIGCAVLSWLLSHHTLQVLFPLHWLLPHLLHLLLFSPLPLIIGILSINTLSLGNFPYMQMTLNFVTLVSYTELNTLL